MSNKLTADISETKSGKIRIEIDKKNFERFCNACGLFKKEFLELLGQSEQDHQQGHTTERESLFELIKE
ncbi:MAG: hypothetical protein GXO74_12825 [Calditrichaeota bacterium]|nr:hypothetical protein [Calditrichota bacterium]